MTTSRIVASALLLAVPACQGGSDTGVSHDRGTHTQASLFAIEQLTTSYYAEGVCVGDFDNDAVLDIAAGPYWYRGPDFSATTAFQTPIVFATNGYSDTFFDFAEDVDDDGWLDIVSVGLPGTAAYWFRNPQGQPGLWARHLVWPSIGNESPTMVDLDSDGERELLAFSGMTISYLQRNETTPTDPWSAHAIAMLGTVGPAVHGLGTGDVNSDGRLDVLVSTGWLEQPASLAGDPLWTFHPHLFAVAGGAQMHVDDVDGDGDADVITSLHAHSYGLSWFEQVPNGGDATFVEHVILPTDPLPGDHNQFSQLHAMQLADIDGDGLRDIVTGKTVLAHNGSDPGSAEPAVLFVLRLDRSNGVAYVPQCADDASGVGRQIVTQDIDGDGRVDVISSNKNGLFVFRNQ